MTWIHKIIESWSLLLYDFVVILVENRNLMDDEAKEVLANI